jgi:hypothetical protein
MSFSKAARSSRTDAPGLAGQPANAGRFDAASLAAASVFGQLVGVDDQGAAQVDWPGNRRGPMAARTLVQFDAAPSASDPPVPVLLVFVGDEAVPVIVGVLQPSVLRAVSAPEVAPEVAPTHADHPASESPITVSLDGRTVSLQAAERLELRCGDSAIVMTADGHVTIRGANLVSRATETNKIRGGAVLIN